MTAQIINLAKYRAIRKLRQRLDAIYLPSSFGWWICIKK